MTHDEVVKHVRAMMWAMQRARSIAPEELTGGDWTPEIVARMLAKLQPWIHGENNILPALETVMNRVDDGGRVDPQEFYNFVYIANHLEPAIRLITVTFGDDQSFPQQPELSWFRGWSDEK